ncbi:MAG: cupin domain-containing protein, partial [Chloroflexota bacterium]|nr:cupin domain-containing protein [Chloroflexota bacterium]
HSREDELVFVLDGRVTFHVASERIEGSPGACVVVPRGSEHGYVIESNHARLLVVLAPAEQGVEEWIGEMSRCGNGRAVGSDSGAEAALAEQDIERLVARAARHGVEITGPRPDGSDEGTDQ